jgi:hypothetical protein
MNRSVYPHNTLYHFTIIVALVAGISGLLMVFAGAGVQFISVVTPDFAGGCILLLIMTILWSGLMEGRTDRAQWIRYAYIGTLLAGIFAVCTLVIALGLGVARLLGGEAADLSPLAGSGFIWTGILAIPAWMRIQKIVNECSRGECSA